MPGCSGRPQDEDEEREEDAGPINPRRLAAFRTALGQLLSTDLFEDDSADVSAVVEAVNRRVRASAGGPFSRGEAVKALRAMDEANDIM